MLADQERLMRLPETSQLCRVAGSTIINGLVIILLSNSYISYAEIFVILEVLIRKINDQPTIISGTMILGWGWGTIAIR